MSLHTQLDDVDIVIIEKLQAKPTLTHSELAKMLNRSQPAIGARIKKLSELGFLCTQIGCDLQKLTELHLVRVDIQTTRADDVMEMGSYCPFVSNVFKMAGEFNIAMYIIASSLKQNDHVLDRHFRDKPYVKSLKISRINGMGKKFIMPMDMRAEIMSETDQDPCGKSPICRDTRLAAHVRSPEELNLA